MPTARPRHTITETDEIVRALDVAARTWPEERGARGRLLLRLIDAGRNAVQTQRGADAARRRESIARTSGALTGTYSPGYLDRLREDWPV